MIPTNSVLLIALGFFFGAFIYTVFFDVPEEKVRVFCVDCAFYQPCKEGGICQLCRETTENNIVNVYTLPDEYCKYGEWK